MPARRWACIRRRDADDLHVVAESLGVVRQPELLIRVIVDAGGFVVLIHPALEEASPDKLLAAQPKTSHSLEVNLHPWDRVGKLHGRRDFCED